MILPAAIQLTQLAAVSAAGQTMDTVVRPLFLTLCAIASLFCTFFLVNGGIAYMTSSGRPDKLEHAKKIIRNSLLGLVLVLAAGAMTLILSHAYHATGGAGTEALPALTPLQPEHTSTSLTDILLKAITSLFAHIVNSAAQPFLASLAYFTHGTPLMAANSSVFDIWLAVVGIADSLFVIVVALLGFHVMSSSSLGMEEIEFKQLLPQLVLGFLAVNMSIFAIDMIIELSNGLIHAINAAFPTTTVWNTLIDVTKQSAGMGLVALMIMVVFLVFATILLVYYVMRLVALYLGAILSPLVVLLWLLPGFKDFAVAAFRTYLTAVFVLFVHVMILLLAASILTGMASGNPDNQLDPLMATVVGIATLITLLKTQSVLNQLSYVSIGPKAIRRLGSQFVNSVSYTTSRLKTVKASR